MCTHNNIYAYCDCLFIYLSLHFHNQCWTILITGIFGAKSFYGCYGTVLTYWIKSMEFRIKSNHTCVLEIEPMAPCYM